MVPPPSSVACCVQTPPHPLPSQFFLREGGCTQAPGEEREVLLYLCSIPAAEQEMSPRSGNRIECNMKKCIECFHSRGQHLCKFIKTKESVCIRKEFNSQRIGLGHQHGGRFIVLGHQHGRRDVM